MMECSCGGVVVEGKSCYRASGERYCYILEDIPAYRCTRCGKVLFEDDVVDRIKKLVNRIERESNEITTGKSSIHSYDY
ncbi:MAG: hypothetical protein ACOCWZ_02070 [Spirochaetota bacterium]|jgi:phage FluMu protein Com